MVDADEVVTFTRLHVDALEQRNLSLRVSSGEIRALAGNDGRRVGVDLDADDGVNRTRSPVAEVISHAVNCWVDVGFLQQAGVGHEIRIQLNRRGNDGRSLLYGRTDNALCGGNGVESRQGVAVHLNGLATALR